MTTSEKIALASFIIAFLSFVLTIFIIYFTQRHNKLSVKPILKIVPFDFENHIAVYLYNYGTGPLLRQKIIFTKGTLSATNLVDLMPEHATIKWSNFSKFEDLVIPPNGNEPLIELRGDVKNQEFNDFKKQVRLTLKGITIECEYYDIYGQKFETGIIKQLEGFGRHFEK